MMDIDKGPWYVAAALTIVMSIATAIGTLASSYLLLGVKVREEADKAAVERRAKGAQLACEKLLASASLAAEINFSADRGYPNAVHASDIASGKATLGQFSVPEAQIVAEQLAFEKRASGLVPFLDESEAEVLNRTTLHHYVVTRLRTSDAVPVQRLPSGGNSFDANSELNSIRVGAAELAAAYREKCTEHR